MMRPSTPATMTKVTKMQHIFFLAAFWRKKQKSNLVKREKDVQEIKLV